MRIAYISYLYPPDTGLGGIGTYVEQISQMMSRLNHQVFVFAASNHRDIEEYEGSVKIIRILAMGSAEFQKKLADVFRKYHTEFCFDFIECPEIRGDAYEIKMQFPDLPLIVRLHAPNYLVESLKKTYIPFKIKLRFLVGSLIRGKWNLGFWRKYNYEADTDRAFTLLADLITAPSVAMKQWVVDNWKISGSKVQVISNPFIPPKKLLSFDPVDDNQTILFFGRLNVLKGMIALTKAMKIILVLNTGWKFRVIGDDGPSHLPNLSMKDWMCSELKNVLDRVEFIEGLVYEKLLDEIVNAEIIVLPSLFESFSYTCAEAMAAAKPIVGSAVGGMVDLLDSGKAGILVDPYSPAQIKSGIERLINNKNERIEFGMHARNRILETFTQDKLGLLFEQSYLQLIEGKNAKG